MWGVDGLLWVLRLLYESATEPSAMLLLGESEKMWGVEVLRSSSNRKSMLISGVPVLVQLAACIVMSVG
jgi:hypothetical protein